METTNSVQRIVFSRDAAASEPVVALSTGLTPADAAVWRRYVTLNAPPGASGGEREAVGVFAAMDAERFILARVLPQEAAVLMDCLLFTRGDLQGMAGNLRWLLEAVNAPLPAASDYNALTGPADAAYSVIPPLPLPTVPTVSLDKRTLALNALLNRCGGEMDCVLRLLAAALDVRGLLVRGFIADVNARLDFVQGLMMLLPSLARPDFTFATQVDDPAHALARLIFSDADADGGRWAVDFTGDAAHVHEGETEPVAVPFPAYVQCLRDAWTGDLKAFVSELRTLELLAARVMPGQSWDDGLRALAARWTLDQRVLAGDPVPPDALKAVIAGEIPPSGDLRLGYVGQLLSYALRERDVEAAQLVTRSMDDDTALDAALYSQLEGVLATAPDSAYFVIRTRLAQGITQGVAERWLPRLHTAAVQSLHVAVRDSDTETLTNWLRLIAREPASYQLLDVLQKGIRAAQERTHTDGALGLTLIVFALKRAPDAVETLLNDEALLVRLPNGVGAALRDYDPAAVLGLASQGREIFLVALRRALDARAAAVFQPQTLEVFWSILKGDQTGTNAQTQTQLAAQALPHKYSAVTMMRELVEEGAAWMTENGLRAWLTLLVADGRDDLFHEMVGRSAARGPSLVAEALHASGRSVEDLLAIMGKAVSSSALTSQQAVDIDLELLSAKHWTRATLPLVEQTARLYQQNPGLVCTRETAWQMFQVASDARAELVARTVAKRLLQDIDRGDAEKTIATDLVRLMELSQWSTSVRQYTLNWWREFVRQQSIPRLQQMERVIDGKKSLEELRAIVQTSIALRRVIGKRSLEDFAESVAMAFSLLQSLSESFDPAPKQPLHFDPATVRLEMEARQNELTPDEQRVLAKNLKELGNIIATLAENRSRATLIRREDEIERQLVTGELEPQSAIDTMKWLAGYLDGLQRRDDNPEESYGV